jgi:glyoxylase-like metal-dependent hydrolase (beta-lactamase superfamily II)
MLDPAPREQYDLGGTTVTYLPDGEVRLHPTVLFPRSGADGWAAYAAYLDPDGRLPVSVGSFLVRTPTHTVLVDLGLGDVDFEVPDLASFKGGLLLKSLADEGIAPEDVDVVLFTHLHHDHVGWTTDVAPNPTVAARPIGGLTFPRATHHVAQQEWDHWRGTAEVTGPDPVLVQEPLAGVINFLASDDEIVPGIRAVSTTGHTPGHTSFVVSSPESDHQLLILGDVMHTQAQIGEPDWNFLFDVDADRGTATRRAVLDRFLDEHTVIAGGHFAGSVFGRLRAPAMRHGWLSGVPTRHG